MKAFLVLCAVVCVALADQLTETHNCVENGMDELSAKIPGLKPWLESHREEFLSLFHDYHECSQKSFYKKVVCMPALTVRGITFRIKLGYTIPSAHSDKLIEAIRIVEKCTGLELI